MLSNQISFEMLLEEERFPDKCHENKRGKGYFLISVNNFSEIIFTRVFQF